MKTKLKDLNNFLFETMERLRDETIKGDELKEELARAQAIDALAGKIIDVHSLNMKTAQFFVENEVMTAKEALMQIGASISNQALLEDKK